jgi:hypothetical protein
MIHRHVSAPECWYRKPSKSTPNCHLCRPHSKRLYADVTYGTVQTDQAP